MELDLLIRDARTRLSPGKLVDISIKNGRILSMGKIFSEKATHTLNAEGKLVTESFVNGHLHLCKVYTLTAERSHWPSDSAIPTSGPYAEARVNINTCAVNK
jgi:predicted amidohydrolase